uniref:MCF.2 cell line derived transforming sequence-like 2 n=1 Tax=Podarcis muralis TaxID=64176 RepID=A0A670I6R2_PODMU
MLKLDPPAIENFAMTVKTIAQMLQTFGTDLAETELPNDVQCTEELLSSHTEQHNKLKVSIRCPTSELLLLPRLVLLDLIALNSREAFAYSNQMPFSNCLNRLLAQLDETERAFDQFWSKHHLKLEQCLQLRHFEQDFREVKLALDNLMEVQAGLTDIGDSVSRVENILKERKQLEERGQEPLEKAQSLALHGDQLIQNNHYAIDSIRPKCVELRRICDDFANETKKKYDILGKSLELHKQLDKASQWCEAGIYLLASQAVDKCQSQEGAETALCDIERFLETAKDHQLLTAKEFYNQFDTILTPEIKVRALEEPGCFLLRPVFCFPQWPARCLWEARKLDVRATALSPLSLSLSLFFSHIINELIETERVYAEELQSIIEGYVSEMDNPDLIHLIPTAVSNKKEVLFGNLSEIYEFHNRIFLKELENCIENPELLGRCFLKRKEDLQIYEKYCQNKPRSEALWRQCGDSLFFQECQRKLDHKLSLDAYLLKPVQRITKYQLLLKEMLKCSKNSEGTAELEEALATVIDIIKSANDSMHQIAITGYEGDVHELGKLLLQGSFNVWTDHKKGHNKVKDLARFKPMQRHLFLYAKILLFCKKREENTDGHEKSPSYSFKNSLKMSTVGITENVKGDHKKFEIWYNGREEVYIIQAASVELKNTWVSEIRKVLTGQLEACRGRALRREWSDMCASQLCSPSLPFRRA